MNNKRHAWQKILKVVDTKHRMEGENPSIGAFGKNTEREKRLITTHGTIGIEDMLS